MMKKKNRLEKVLAISLLMSAFMPFSVHAYVDPGAGALLWQLILAALFGLMFFIRGIFAKVKKVFGWARKKMDEKRKR